MWWSLLAFSIALAACSDRVSGGTASSGASDGDGATGGDPTSEDEDDDEGGSVCDPWGEPLPCYCPDGKDGTKDCRIDAMGWESCDCSDETSTTDVGPSGASGTTTWSTSSSTTSSVATNTSSAATSGSTTSSSSTRCPSPAPCESFRTAGRPSVSDCTITLDCPSPLPGAVEVEAKGMQWGVWVDLVACAGDESFWLPSPPASQPYITVQLCGASCDLLRAGELVEVLQYCEP